MTRGKLTESDTLEAGPDTRFAELCGPEGADEEESADAHPGYGSLLGLGVRKQAKKPVIVLAPEVAEQAAQVMEINAGQLVVRGGHAPNGFGALGLGSLGDGEDGEPFGALGELDAPAEAYEESDQEQDAALAEWAVRALGNGESEAVETVWAEEELAAEEPAFDEPVHEEAIVEQAWLDWARALAEPAATAAQAPDFEQADDLPEPEPLAPAVDAIELAEPELPKHELRQLVAQISRPRPSRHLWRRAVAYLKRLLA
jgi:hypothetical protein